MKQDLITPEQVLSFFVDEVGPQGWFVQSDELDAKIVNEYSALWEHARAGHLNHWLQTPNGTLALVTVLDQFPRNMFRHDGRAYATDPAARKIAKRAMFRGDDLKTPEPARMLYYMPLMHAECSADQDASVRAFAKRVSSPNNLLHARAHREIIRAFGRFPTRNAMLGRKSSLAEMEYLNSGGYGAIVQRLSANA